MQTSAQKIMLLTDKQTERLLNRACGCARYAYNWARVTWLNKKRQDAVDEGKPQGCYDTGYYEFWACKETALRKS